MFQNQSFALRINKNETLDFETKLLNIIQVSNIHPIKERINEVLLKTYKEYLDVDITDLLSSSDVVSAYTLEVEEDMGILIINKHETIDEINVYEFIFLSKDNLNNFLAWFNELLLDNSILNEDDKYEGSYKEYRLSQKFEKIKNTHRTELINSMEDDFIEIISDEYYRNKLQQLSDISPGNLIDVAYFIDVLNFKKKEVNKMVLSKVINKVYAIRCDKCSKKTFKIIQMPFNNKEDIKELIMKKSIICPDCSEILNEKDSSIIEVYTIPNLTKECIKGLWLEAYCKNILKKMDVKEDKLKICGYYENNELDICLMESDNLLVFECKDKNIGQNDIYILTVKANRINADKVIIVTTQELQDNITNIVTKDDENEDDKYIFICGSSKHIEKEMNEIIQNLRNQKNQLLINSLMIKLYNGIWQRRGLTGIPFRLTRALESFFI